MIRLPLACAFVVVLAQANCVPGCDAASCEVTEKSGVRVLEPDDLETVYLRDDCSTCDHSTIRTTWRYAGTPVAGGFVRVTVRFRCSDGSAHTYNVARTAVIPATEIVYEGVGVKNVCGDKSRVLFSAIVENESGTDITADATIACPVFEADSPTAPTGSLPANGKGRVARSEREVAVAPAALDRTPRLRYRSGRS